MMVDHSDRRKSTKIDKKAEANQKRLDSLKNNRLVAKAREDAIRQSLKCTDSSRQKNKVIKFASSDEDEPATGIEPKSDRHMLFNDEDNEIASSNFDFPLKNQTMSGQKLLALQSKVGLDSRFKMGENFLDDLPDEEQSRDLAKNADSDEISHERSQQMNILEKVLGKTLKIDSKSRIFDQTQNFDSDKCAKYKKHKNSSGFMVRFDPQNPDHHRFKRSAKSGENDEILHGKKSKKEELQDVEILLESLDDRQVELEQEKMRSTNYKVDTTFAERLKEQLSADSSKIETTKNQGFSLLASLGRQKIDTKNDVPANLKIDQCATKSKLADWKRDLMLNPKVRKTSESSEDYGAKDEKSESESESEPESPSSSGFVQNVSDVKLKAQAKQASKRSLFFFYDDEKLMEAVAVFSDGEKFHRTQDLEIVREKWSKLRTSLQKASKKKRKNAVRNMKKQQAAQEVKQQRFERRHKRLNLS